MDKRRKPVSEFEDWNANDFLIWKNETSDLFFQIKRIHKMIAILVERSYT